MNVNFKIGGYEQLLIFNHGLKFNCTCEDFTFRQVTKKPIGKCKHIKKAISWIDKRWLKN